MPTAILRFLTAEGFVVAADGLSRDRETGAIRSTTEQKIFRINEPSRSLVYSLWGTGRITDPTESFIALDLVKECAKAVAALAKQAPSDLLAYAKDVGLRLKKALEDSKNAGKIYRYPPIQDPAQPGQYLIVQVFFWGYYNGSAARADVKVTHQNQTMSPLQVNGTHVEPTPEIRGSSVGNVLLTETPDPRLSEFWIPAMRKFSTSHFSANTFSVSEARDISVNYIRACESKAGHEIDPHYAPGIGGRVHIATVTPKEADWLPGYAPIQESGPVGKD